jgi:hypothetical protein
MTAETIRNAMGTLNRVGLDALVSPDADLSPVGTNGIRVEIDGETLFYISESRDETLALLVANRDKWTLRTPYGVACGGVEYLSGPLSIGFSCDYPLSYGLLNEAEGLPLGDAALVSEACVDGW